MTKFLLSTMMLLLNIISFNNLYSDVASNDTTRPVMVVETTQGTFEVTLFPDIAPKAVENFTKHAEDHYYEGTIFHRIIPKFMIQSGDPQGNGTGGESIWGKAFEDEFSPNVKFDKPGKLAMANKGPKTNGSQFFITTASTPWLNQKHTIFGEVTKGYEVIQKIEALPTGAQNKPNDPPKIIKISPK